jgi:hypothetical protein
MGVDFPENIIYRTRVTDALRKTEVFSLIPCDHQDHQGSSIIDHAIIGNTKIPGTYPNCRSGSKYFCAILQGEVRLGIHAGSNYSNLNRGATKSVPLEV